MPTVDFSQWAAADLVLPLGGRTYVVRPPSVDQARLIIALAIRSEISLHLSKGPVPSEVQAILEQLDVVGTPLADITLGSAVHEELRENGVPLETITRMSYYALHFWARGQARADAIAKALWGSDAQGEASGRAPRPGQPLLRSGLNTGSVAQTQTGGIQTIGSQLL